MRVHARYDFRPHPTAFMVECPNRNMLFYQNKPNCLLCDKYLT